MCFSVFLLLYYFYLSNEARIINLKKFCLLERERGEKCTLVTHFYFKYCLFAAWLLVIRVEIYLLFLKSVLLIPLAVNA